MRLIKLKKIKEFTDSSGDWIICRDSEGWEWTVKRRIYEEFKYIGFPIMRKGTYEKLFEIVENKHYPTLPKEKRYQLIKQLLEISTQTSISTLFPNLQTES